jgi:hypothetical protein
MSASIAVPAKILTAAKLPASISPSRNARRASRELAAKDVIATIVNESVRSEGAVRAAISGWARQEGE